MTPLPEKITEWANYLSITVSRETAKQYEYHLRQLANTAPARLLEEWSTAQLIAYVGQRRAAGMGEAMTKQTVAAFRHFWKYAAPGNLTAAKVLYPKIHKRRQRTLSPEAAIKLLTSCDTATHAGTRDLAILTLMLDSGIRAAELCRLALPRVDLAKRRFVVVVKGGDEGVGVFSQSTAAHLSRWLAIRPQYARPEEQAVFVSFGGTTPGKAFTRDGLRGLFRNLGKQAGLEAFSPHDLRRTFATIAIRTGAPTRVVQAAGRWGDIALVERYTQDIEAEDFERYSPVESLMKGRP